MINSREIKIKNSVFKAKQIKLSDSSDLLMIEGRKGFIMCGYLNINTAQKRADAACIVTGVKTIDDMLNASVAALTSEAQKLGISMGMSVKEALEKLS